MYDHKESEAIIQEFALTGASKADIVVKAAETELDWPYVWGAVGKRLCTVVNRKSYMNSSKIASGDIELIRKRCPILSGKQTECRGCAYYPNEVGVWIADCQGFVKRIFGYVGISFSGGGCTSMWNAAKNWQAKGEIATMPKDKVCCVFKKVNSVMEHILIYDGNGHYFHDSGEVKKQSTSSYKATHWAIPKGLYDGGAAPMPTPVPVTPTRPTIRKGSANEYVTEAQRKLIELGYDLGNSGADGKFGAKTEAAVKAFQKASGLKADGIVGKDTWGALDAADAGFKPVIDLYTVTIPHLTREKAEELVTVYAPATMIKE